MSGVQFRPWIKWRSIGIIFVLSLMVALSVLALGHSVRDFIDNALASKGMMLGIVKMLSSAGLFAVSSLLRSLFVNLYADRYAMNVSAALHDCALQRSPIFFQSFPHSYIISCITNDVSFIRHYIASTASYSIRNIMMFLGALALMFYISTRITLILMLIIPMLLLILGIGLRKVRRLMAMQRGVRDALIGKLSGYLVALPTLQAFNMVGDVAQTRERLCTSFCSQGVRLYWYKSLTTASILLGVLCIIIATMVEGTSAVINGTLTAGSFAVFVLYSIIATVSLLGLSDVYSATMQLQNSRARIKALLNSDLGVIKSGVIIPAQFDIRFDKVSFAYPSKSEIEILKDFSYHIPYGKKVAIVGLSGIGKSTIMNLLLRFYEPQSGMIAVGDVPIGDLQLDAWRQKISVVLQEHHVMPVSLWDNICYNPAQTAVTDDLIKMLSLHQLFDISNDTESAVAADQDVKLSPGEQQRIALIRCLNKQDAEIFIFDEAITALDKGNRDKAMQAIKRYTEGKTVIFITHHHEEYSGYFDTIIDLSHIGGTVDTI